MNFALPRTYYEEMLVLQNTRLKNLQHAWVITKTNPIGSGTKTLRVREKSVKKWGHMDE